MASQLDQWFIHAVSDNVTHLAQQKEARSSGAFTVKEGVTGKTYPFQRLAAVSMTEVFVRDGDTQYLNPTQSKRRANLRDFTAAVLIDDFDVVKTLTDPKSEFALALARARNRTIDDLMLGVAAASSGGVLGLAATVDEGAETTGTSALSSFDGGSHVIANGGTNLTMAKIRSAAARMNEQEVPDDERYFFYSAKGMEKLLSDSQVTSSDYSTIRALQSGGFSMDAVWMGFKWRRSQRLPLSGNIRSCIAVQKEAAGFAVALTQDVEIDKAVHKNNNYQVLIKYSGGGVRIDDAGVVQVDIDESV